MNTEILQTLLRGAIRSTPWLVGPALAVGLAGIGYIEWDDTAFPVLLICFCAFIRETALNSIQIASQEYIAELELRNAVLASRWPDPRESEATS